MKRPFPLSRRQLLLALAFLFAFAGITLFLFRYKREEKQFSHITSQLFTDEMTSSTLNMHYTIANPADFGIYSYKPILPSYSKTGTLKGQAATENVIAALKSLNPEKLSDADSYTHRLLLRSLDNSLKAGSFVYYKEPLSPSSGMQSQLPILLAEYAFRTERDVTDYLSILDQTDEYFASLLVFEQEKAQAGLLMPASSLEKVKEQCDTIVTSEALEAGTHFLQSTFTERVDALCQEGILTEEEAQAYQMQNDRLLKTVLLPAYEALADGLFVLEDTSIPLEGLASKPEGRAYYEYLLVSETGSYRSIEEIKELLSAKFSQEYEAIQRIVAQNPTLVQRLSSEEYAVFPYTEAEEMLLDLQRRMSGSFPQLPEDTSAMPAVTVKAVSQSLEEYCAPAFYLTAPLDDTDSNVIYINEKNSPGGLELYTTLAHEGYPGHLYQTVYSNRSFLSQGENKVRQLLWYGGYQEGWALYVEFLSFDYASALLEENGRSQDALCVQLEKHNRSLQLCLYSLLDIMIHDQGASFRQVAEVLENFGITQVSSIKAIYAYIAEEPCNYLKYYLGFLEILSLQQEAMAQWGDSYSDYAFHTFFLDCGPSDFTSLKERLLETTPDASLIPIAS
ncbi:MAG TPA: DUF885 domain-containing protein [Candidatus Acetatifactor stercoripullorum]|uniref:DUF885 domain-containing protein n=1 Tax=Candidatus Acetatifactor stercoripullorum TaxID=2838414 RepID=A0A9D1UB79_9FIRM|nr:DUF885 domain-containing protein [uncultured Acetatifactor sp.]HIW80863.1 DUF885 domain-containing protein [Candidatus Acetatifactor stercoripullorum]